MAKKKMAVKVAGNRQMSFRLSAPKRSIVMPLMIMIGLTLTVALAAQLHGWWEQALPIKKVVITNQTSQISAELLKEVIKQYQQQSERKIGMFAIELDSIKKIIESNPWVRQISVTKQWPETLAFEIEEKKALVKINNSALLDDGLLAEAYQHNALSSLATINWDQSKEFSSDERLRAYEIFRKLQKKFEDRKHAIKAVNINDNGDWNLRLVDEKLMIFGKKNQQQRAERLLAVWSKLKDKNQIARVDLRYSNGFAVKYKNNSTEPEKQAG